MIIREISLVILFVYEYDRDNDGRIGDGILLLGVRPDLRTFEIFAVGMWSRVFIGVGKMMYFFFRYEFVSINSVNECSNIRDLFSVVFE